MFLLLCRIVGNVLMHCLTILIPLKIKENWDELYEGNGNIDDRLRKDNLYEQKFAEFVTR